jgi:hypothetical protein
LRVKLTLDAVGDAAAPVRGSDGVSTGSERPVRGCAGALFFRDELPLRTNDPLNHESFEIKFRLRHRRDQWRHHHRNRRQ